MRPGLWMRSKLMLEQRANLQESDPDLWSAILAEASRQEDHVELIAWENQTSPNVMAAQGTVLTNKYAESYPGKRYYGGCEAVDVAERLAIERAKALFGADYANVQPHSGAQANAALFVTRKQAETALARAHIRVNKNALPNDPKPPFVISGIRLRAATATTRGFGVAECRQLAEGMGDVLDAIHDDDVALRVRRQVRALCERLPVYRASGKGMCYGR